MLLSMTNSSISRNNSLGNSVGIEFLLVYMSLRRAATPDAESMLVHIDLASAVKSRAESGS